MRGRLLDDRSASGNDFIDEAVEPGSGNGILNGVHGAPPDLKAEDCYNLDAVAELVTSTASGDKRHTAS